MFKRSVLSVSSGHVARYTPLIRPHVLASPAIRFQRFATSSDCTSTTPPSLSASEADLLRRMHYLRERAIDIERRTTQALEQAGHLPPPKTPIAAVAPQLHDDRKERLIDDAAQPSVLADMQEWLDGAMQRITKAEQQLRRFAPQQQQQQQQQSASSTELDDLTDEIADLKQSARTVREAGNEVKQDEDENDVRLRPIPVVSGPEEPVWIAVPLRGEGEEGEQRAEEQAGSQAAAAAAATHDTPTTASDIKDDKHIHRHMSEDKATGRPEKETGVSRATPQHTAPHRRPVSRAVTACVSFIVVSCPLMTATDGTRETASVPPSYWE